MLASTVLRESLQAADFERPDAARRAELDRLFADARARRGFPPAVALAADGTVAYSTDHRLIGTRIAAPAHVAEARRGTSAAT